MPGTLTLVHERAPVSGPVIDLTDAAVGLGPGDGIFQRLGVLVPVGEAVIDAWKSSGKTEFVVRLSDRSWELADTLAFWWSRWHDQALSKVDASGHSRRIDLDPRGTIELVTPRLKLTTCARFARETCGSYFEAIHGSGIFDTILWDGPSAPADIADAGMGFERELHRGPRSTAVFSIVLRETNRRIGGCGYRIAARDGGRGEIGYMLEPASHGFGFATEAVEALVWFAFMWRGARRVEAAVFPGNIASRRVLEKNGFVLECTAESGGQKRKQPREEWRFGLTEGMWKMAAPCRNEGGDSPRMWVAGCDR